MNNIHTITKENFEKEVLQSDRPVLIDFWAGWCGPCRMITPVIEEIASEATGIKVCKINIDEQNELASSFQIMSIPTLAVVKNGQVTKRTVGLQPKSEILKMLD